VLPRESSTTRQNFQTALAAARAQPAIARAIAAPGREANTLAVQPGDLLANRFQLEAHSASGGMGQVFRARDRFSGSQVAVKLLRERRAGWDARFLREAEMLASLHHPAIVRHVAHGAMPGGQRYLVMEWLEGEELATRLLRGPLQLSEVLALARQVADALACAHARGVVHRDLKPHNLWLVDGEPARVKVLDFGVARLDGHSSVSHTAVIGTPGYMAPEQVRGTFDIDARADVFALGCVLHECLTGRPLFQADHVIGMLAKILLEPVPSLRPTLPELPAFLDSLLTQMLAKPRELRPLDGAAVRRALDARVEPAASAPRSDTLSMAERRTLTLLLIGSGVGSDGSTPDFEYRTPGIAEQRVRALVAAHGGTLEQLADGTAIVSFAGVDQLATDRAARAARCALALAPACPHRPLSLVTGRAEQQVPLGAAIDRGTATLARVDADEGGGPITIDQLSANLLDARFELAETRHGLLLVGERELAHGVRRLLGKATACVGRRFELAALRGTFAACVEERVARAVLVSARPGIGKSRLAAELVEQLQHAHPTLQVWLARGDPLRTGSAFGLLAQLLRARLSLRADDSLARQQACIRERVARGFPLAERERAAAFLGELLAVPFDDLDITPLRTARRDPELMHAQLSRVFVEFVRAELSSGPQLWILEDLHWGDLPSMRFVDAALAELCELPWLVLALARPELLERAPGLWADRGLSVLHLKPLTPRAGARLVAQALDCSPDDERVAKVVELAAGNAFYLEELARALGEGKHGAEQLPETVLAMIEARLASLDDQERRVLRAASVFGEACWEGGLSHLMGGELDPVRLHHCLARLTERELLGVRSESRFAGERELAFRHALLREGAYAQLTEQDRGLGHRLAADWLEQHGEPSPAVLALHLERGGELARAGARYASAAHVANLGADLDAVLSHARSGLRCGVSDRVAGELHGLIIKVLSARKGFAAARPHVEALAERSTSDSPLRLSVELVPIMLNTLRAERTPDLAELAAALESAVSVPLNEASLDVFGAVLGWSHYELDAMGEYALSQRTDLRYAEQLRRFAGREATAAGWLALRDSYQSSLFLDEPYAGLEHARQALRAFQEAEHPGGCAVSNTFIGLHAQALGAPDEAERALRAARGVEISTLGSLRDLVYVVALLDEGADECAEHEARSFLERDARRHGAELGRAHWARGMVLLRRGHLDSGEDELATALSQLGRWPVEHAAATVSLAGAQLVRGRLERACALMKQAEAELHALRARGYRGVLNRYLPVRAAEVCAAAGQSKRARDYAALAVERVRASAACISDPSYRERFIGRQVYNVRALELARGYGVG
jgi:eukaryotic-like serine/threonine-protein kinase